MTRRSRVSQQHSLTMWWRKSWQIRVHTTENHCQFVFYHNISKLKQVNMNWWRQHRCLHSYLSRRINQSESEKLLSCGKTSVWLVGLCFRCRFFKPVTLGGNLVGQHSRLVAHATLVSFGRFPRGRGGGGGGEGEGRVRWWGGEGARRMELVEPLLPSTFLESRARRASIQ